MSPPLLARSPLFTVLAFLALALAAAATVGVVGCELAVHPDLGLAEVSAPTCIPCLDAADTVITEPDGNVVIVPVAAQDDGGGDDDDDGDDASDFADAASTGVDP